MEKIIFFDNPILGNSVLDNGICVNRDPYGYANKHGHSFFEIQYILVGGGTYYIEEEKYTAKANDVFFINHGVKHHFMLDPNSIIINLIFESPNIFSEETAKNLELLPLHSRLSALYSDKIKNLIFDTENEILNRKAYYETIVKCNVEKILLLLLQFSHLAKKQTKVSTLSTDIIKYIDENLLDISLSKIANKFNYNVAYFSRIFHKTVGMTFSEYVTTAKLNNALHLIITTNKNLEEISALCGFKNHNIFCQKFKQYTQQTPSEYRRNWKMRGK